MIIIHLLSDMEKKWRWHFTPSWPTISIIKIITNIKIVTLFHIWPRQLTTPWNSQFIDFLCFWRFCFFSFRAFVQENWNHCCPPHAVFFVFNETQVIVVPTDDKSLCQCLWTDKDASVSFTVGKKLVVLYHVLQMKGLQSHTTHLYCFGSIYTFNTNLINKMRAGSDEFHHICSHEWLLN